MSIDLSQFHQVFFEESYEGLDTMESGLLAMDIGQPDSEVINDIFRAAHSIKGGSGTFGFSQVADFTHVVETLLDEVRSGDRAITQTSLDLLLSSVDCIRGLLEQLQAGDDPDLSQAKSLKAEFEAVLAGQEPSGATQSTESDSASSTSESVETAGDQSAPPPSQDNVGEGNGNEGNGNEGDGNEGDGGGSHGWKIYFCPEAELLQSGNEPTRMFRQLSELCDGQFFVKAVTNKLPTVSAMNPEYCYLAWHIELRSAVDRADVDEVFEWVVDSAEIIIEPLALASTSTDPIASQPASETASEPSSTQPSVQANTPAAAIEPSKASANETSEESAKEPSKETAKANKSTAQESSSIRVSIDKVDSLINMVGELVITQSMLGQLGRDFDISRVQRLQEGLAQLEHNTRELQESVMKIRMMPISFVFSRFPRLVRDVSRTLSKKIELVMAGENTELDKTVMEKIGDPLVHLIRNSIDHGIEKPDVRASKGKPETGKVHLNAYHQSGNIVIEIKDDGAGLNTEKILQKAKQKGLVPEDAQLSKEQIFDLIFHAGFSTADQVSDLSGRGVGMDVVRSNIAALNGSIEVTSETDKGTRFVIRLPLTLAILDGQLVRVGEQIFIFPLVSIVESIQSDDQAINNVGGYSDVLKLRDEYVPILQLSKAFNIPTTQKNLQDQIICVVEADGEKSGVVVDELLGQQQVVIKSLEENYRKVEGISGATILGDGTVALIIDISGLAKMSGVSLKHLDSAHKAA